MEIILIVIGLVALGFIVKQIFSKKFWTKVKDHIIDKTAKAIGSFVFGLVIIILLVIFVVSSNK